MKNTIGLMVMIATIILAVGLAGAQTLTAVDINKAILSWTWVADGNGGIPDTFRMKCGNQTGVYTKITDVAYPTNSMPVKSAISGSGNWFCVVTASNQFGESGPSNELPFVAGAIPSSPTSLTVLAQ